MQNTFPGFKTHTCRTQTHQDFLFKMCQCFFKSIAAHHPQSRNLPQTSHKVSPPFSPNPRHFWGLISDTQNTNVCWIKAHLDFYSRESTVIQTRRTRRCCCCLITVHQNVTKKHVYIHKQAPILTFICW